MIKADEYWVKCLEICRKELNSVSFRTIFPYLTPLYIKDNVLYLETNQELYKDMALNCYNKYILNAFSQLGMGVDSFDVILKENEVKKEEVTPEIKNKESSLIPRFTFDSFIISDNNNFACAAALAVSEMPANRYNPLLIHGGTGLGKTHLLHAVGNKIQADHPDWNIVCITAEKFMNTFVESIRREDNIEFRQKFRNIDVLLLDDIQFFAGKEGTQVEFFHTFNELISQNKQIMMTSDRPPKDIYPLEERLRTRIAGGLITDIQPPDFETRLAILHQKAREEVVTKNIDEEIFNLVAKQVKTNIRELEGAIKTIIAFSNISKEDINIDTANKILGDYFSTSERRKIDANLIIKEVEKRFDLANDSLKGKKRDKSTVFPRHIAMYICRELTELSLPNIGNEFGGRDHTTVMNGIKKVKKQIENDLNTMRLINDLIKSIKEDS